MKQSIFSMVFAFISMVATPQKNVPQPVNYEAVNWHTWLLDKPEQITIPAPPTIAQSKVELQTIKQGLNKPDDKKMQNIKYWNAGAPSYRWNQMVNKLTSLRPDVQLRMPGAWMNIAIYDATILAWKEKVKYKRKRPIELDPTLKLVINGPMTYAYPCEHTITAAAAAKVLAYFFPEKADSILQLAHSAAQSRIDAGVQFPSDIDAGWKLGEQVALQIIEKAKNDGSAIVWKGEMNKDPKKWTGTYPMGITLASFTPIMLRAADQFRPSAPPDFESDMKEMKNFKQTFRTRSIAYFWANAGPELWTDLASQKMWEYHMSDDAPSAARIYTVLHTAYHDAVIALFDAKYTYWGIRPIQYDTTYKSLIPTPPFPGYPSGHAGGAGTSSSVLEYFFPADAKEFQHLAKECADSRFYAGIHFRTDNEIALKMGEDIGKYIVETWMKK
jgi:membrane-associated phospholipid phosphatase